jgi:hypothetical protein
MKASFEFGIDERLLIAAALYDAARKLPAKGVLTRSILLSLAEQIDVAVRPSGGSRKIQGKGAAS